MSATKKTRKHVWFLKYASRETDIQMHIHIDMLNIISCTLVDGKLSSQHAFFLLSLEFHKPSTYLMLYPISRIFMFISPASRDLNLSIYPLVYFITFDYYSRAKLVRLLQNVRQFINQVHHNTDKHTLMTTKAGCQ